MEVGEEPISSLCFRPGKMFNKVLSFWVFYSENLGNLLLWVESGNENMIYVASGKQVKSFDVRLVIINSLTLCIRVFDIFTCWMLRVCHSIFKGSSCSWKPLESFDYNKEEINQVLELRLTLFRIRLHTLTSGGAPFLELICMYVCDCRLHAALSPLFLLLPMTAVKLRSLLIFSVHM